MQVNETTNETSDNRKGKKKISLSRSISDKTYSVQKTKDRNGREETVVNKINIENEDAFDREWEQIQRGRRNREISGRQRRNNNNNNNHNQNLRRIDYY